MAKKFFYVCVGLLMLAATYHLGTKNARAASGLAVPTEVATLCGVLANGGTIPLPVYADGTTALESECSWTVSPSRCYSGYYAYTLNCYTTGRVVSVAFFGNDTPPASPPPQANYLIVATRGASAPTRAASQSFGALKAKYR